MEATFTPGTLPTISPAGAAQLRAHLLDVPRCAESLAAAISPAPPRLVDIRDLAPGICLLPAPSWSDGELRFQVRVEVAQRLRQAAEHLPSDLRLGFWEGYRPLGIQRRLWHKGLCYLRTEHPGTPSSVLEEILEHYVARPDGPPPPHSTGSAVDIAPVDAFGRPLAPLDAWGRLANEILGRVLRDSGLVNYDPEWWHWSYGDHEWARANDCAPLPFALASEFDGPGGGI